MENNTLNLYKQALALSLKTELLTSNLKLLPRFPISNDHKKNYDRERKVYTHCKVIFQKINNQVCNVIGSIKEQADSQVEMIKEGEKTVGEIHACFKDIVFTKLIKEMSIQYPEYYSQLTEADIQKYMKQCEATDEWRHNLQHQNQVKSVDIKVYLDS